MTNVRTDTLTNRTDISDVHAARDAAREAIDRLIDLGFLRDDSVCALAAHSQLLTMRTLITDAIVAAFPRVEIWWMRSRMIGVFDAISPPDHEGALALLRRLAADDPHAEVRMYARQISYNLEDRVLLERDLAARRGVDECDRGPAPGSRRAGDHPRECGPRRSFEPVELRLEIRLVGGEAAVSSRVVGREG